MKKRSSKLLLLVPVVGVLLSVGLLSCQEDETDAYLDSVDAAAWAMSDTQTVKGVTFTLTPCGSDYVVRNEFREGESVNFVLSMTNNRAESLRIWEWQLDAGNPDSEEYGKYFIGIVSESGEYVVGINEKTYPDWVHLGITYRYDIPAGTTVPTGSENGRMYRWRNVNCFEWPAKDFAAVAQEDVPIEGVWENLPCVAKGVYTGIVRTKLPFYEVEYDEASLDYVQTGSEPLFVADIDLSVKFVVRKKQ